MSEPQLERRIAEYGRLGLPVAVVVGAVIAGSISGPPAAVLVLAGGALVGVIAIFWASLRVLLGETPLSGADAYAFGAPRAEEEQKQAVLRALKDLEFERSVGKISDEDYSELVAKYRAEAKRLLRQLDADAQPRREQVAALVAKRLRRAGVASDDGAGSALDLDKDDGAGSAPDKDDGAGSALDKDDGAQGETAEETDAAKRRASGKGQKRSRQASARDADEGAASPQTDAEAAAEARGAEDGGEPPPTRVCASCGTPNDADAVFCKKCGTRCTPTSEPEASTKSGATKSGADDAGPDQTREDA